MEFNPVVTESEVMTPPVKEKMPSLGPSRFHNGSNCLRQQTAVDRWVVKANIELYGGLLKTEADVTKRAIIASLLASEVEKTIVPKTEDGPAARIILVSRSG